MINRAYMVSLGLVLVLGNTGAAFAQDLSGVMAGAASYRQELQRIYNNRMDEFAAAPENGQRELLVQAEEGKKRVQAAIDNLNQVYTANEIDIASLNDEVRTRADELGLAELSGIARQVAADNAASLEQSMINARFASNPGGSRVEFLRNFAPDRLVPTIPELERLWFELYREIEASGRVERITIAVVGTDGATLQREVIGIGPFTAVTEEGFLTYLPSLATLNILPRQLPGEFQSTLAELFQVREGYVHAVADPSRGVVTRLYVDRPTWMERIHRGELVGYVIIAVGLAGALAFVYQLAFLLYARVGVGQQLRNPDHPVPGNALGRVLLAFKGDADAVSQQPEIAELRISEAVMQEVPALERFQAFLRLAVAAGPLLGLVGTVVGMIITFQSITESGSSDPRLMAAGIGQAMIATLLGLGIAVPLLFANAMLNTLSRSVIQVLDEQSTGMLATMLEKKAHV